MPNSLRQLPRRVRDLGFGPALAVSLAVAMGPTVASSGGTALASEACQETTITAPAVADAWVDQDGPFSNKGSDAVMTVRSAVPDKNARILVRFALPSAPPPGCVVEVAKLRLFAGAGDESRRLEAVRLAFGWSESLVTWGDQPGTVGAPAATWAGEGYIQWNVASQVQEMIGGANHGFVIRDETENDEFGGDQSLYSREKGESNPELLIRFAAPKTGEPTGPPAPPAPAAVRCGEELLRSTLVTNDLSECPGDGLVIGEERIIVDLGGHTIDGVGLGTGVRNDGYDTVTIRNGTIQDFDFGVQLLPQTDLNVIERLSLRLNQLGGVQLSDAGAPGAGNEVRSNLLDQNGDGIGLVKGTLGTIVTGNVLTLSSGPGLRVTQSDGNWLEGNSVSESGDLGVDLEQASGNTVLGNTVSGNSDGGVEVVAASNGNRIEDNVVLQSGDHGILVSESDRNELIGNTAQLMSDSGITLNTANDGAVRGNDVRFNSGGIQMDGSSRNRVESNNASETTGIGIELGGGSLENDLVGNLADDNGSTGIYLSDEATDDLGNLVERNVANRNLGDGIATGKGGHTLSANVANENGSLGINAAPGTIDGGRNGAADNRKPEQCMGVVCRLEWNPPETTITDHPGNSTTSGSVTFRFAGSDDRTPPAGLRFECRLDGAGFTSCSSPRLYSGLREGSHTFEVRAIDQVGNVDESPASHSWAVDTTPPNTSIDSKPRPISSSTEASFALSASEAGSSFECRLDNEAFTGCASPQLYEGLGDGAHSFEVRAIDRAGNVDQSPASYSWTVDTVAPDTSVGDRPADPSNSGAARFTFAGSEAGSSFECRLDNEAFTGCASPKLYEGLGDGAHSFEVRAVDRAGNVDPSPASYSWTVDTVAPETSLGERPPDPSNSRAARFGFDGSDDRTAAAALRFECRLDNSSAPDFAPCSSPKLYDGLGDGAHSFEVRAIDRAGNVDPSPASYSWTVDTVAPDTSIDSGPSAASSSTQASFAFAGSDDRTAPAGLSFECRLDSSAAADFAPCASRKLHSGLGDGPHTFDVRAIDRAGNVDPSPASYSWTVDTVAPDTSVGERPADPSSSAAARFTFAGSEAGSSFECRLDNEAFTGCASPKLYEGLSDGAHSFEVRAIDRAGNADQSSARHSWTVDTVAPTTSIGSGPPATSSGTEANFAFAASEAGSHFECRLDGAAVGFVDCQSPKLYAGLTDGSHTFEVRAIDRAGNVDQSPATYGWIVDTVAPDTSLGDRPADPSDSASARFTFSAGEAGSSFQCRLDGSAATEFAPCSSPKLYEGLSDGAHSFEVRAIDLAGNVDQSPASYGWTIDTASNEPPPDTTPPQTTLGARPPDPNGSRSASFAFTGSDDRTAETALRFECRLDSSAATDFAPCPSPKLYEGLGDGSHSFDVRAVDLAGNVDQSPASYSWTVDTTAPNTSIDSNPPVSSSSTQASFAFSASETGSSFQCRVDSSSAADFVGCSSPRFYSGLSQGSHRFDVRAIDRAGNVDSSPATYSWTIDTTPPNTSIESGPPASTSSTDASFSFSATEAGSSFQCRLDGTAAADFAPCSSPRLYQGLSQGRHSFEVRAIDQAGNIDATPASHAWTIAAPSASCVTATVTLGAAADSWVLQSSATSNYGNDSVVKVDSKAAASARVLVRFALPAIPAGCRVVDAKLRLYASSYKTGRTLEALMLTAPWTEGGLTWNNQPAPTGTAATVTSGAGYREWTVTSQAQSMYSGGNHGFLIRDSAEGGGGIEQGLHSREKGTDNPPQLVVTFG